MQREKLEKGQDGGKITASPEDPMEHPAVQKAIRLMPRLKDAISKRAESRRARSSARAIANRLERKGEITKAEAEAIKSYVEE